MYNLNTSVVQTILKKIPPLFSLKFWILIMWAIVLFVLFYQKKETSDPTIQIQIILWFVVLAFILFADA